MFINECKSYSIKDIIVKPVYGENGTSDRNLNPGDYVRHFKGNIYRILGTAIHTETKEGLVIYESVTAPEKTVYARPLDMFMSEVDHEKYPGVSQTWRLEKVTITEKFSSRKEVAVEMTFGRQSEELCGKTISEFFSKHYNAEMNSVRVWNTKAKNDIYRDVPILRTPDITGECSGVKLTPAKDIKDGITLKFSIGTALTETVMYGDNIYIIGENRLVIGNNKDGIYEVFDIVQRPWRVNVNIK